MESFWALGRRLDFLATGETAAGHYSIFHIQRLRATASEYGMELRP